MSVRSSGREIRVGVAVLLAIVLVIGLFKGAGGGPGFLASSRSIDVIFRDGQGIRAGSAVRIAGLDAGRVTGVDLTEVAGVLRARVRIALPTALAAKLRQDVRVTIQSTLTGQSRINIVSSGKSEVALVPGQVIEGVETTVFDPILEQVGLGPVERSHLSHTIAEVRETVDAVGPRVRQILASLQETAAGIRETSELVRPNVEATTGHVEELARRLATSAPKVEASLARLQDLTQKLEGMLDENRPNIQATLASVRDLAATSHDILVTERPKVTKLLVGLDGTRTRLDRVLYQSDRITTQGAEMLTAQRADLERTISNVRDATDWADKLVQKIYANPFVLSPFYKPTPEDVRVQAVYDTAQVFSKGARELHDAVKSLESLQAAPRSPEQQQAMSKLYEKAWTLTSQLNLTSQQLAEGLKPRARR